MVKINKQVLQIFQSDRKPHQVVSDSENLSFLERHWRVSHECWALCKTLNTTQTFSKHKDLQGLQKLRNLFFSSFDSQWNHGSESSHLFSGQFVIFVCFQARIDDILNSFMFLEPVSNMECTRCLLNNSSFKSFDAPQD